MNFGYIMIALMMCYGYAKMQKWVFLAVPCGLACMIVMTIAIAVLEIVFRMHKDKYASLYINSPLVIDVIALCLYLIFNIQLMRERKL